MTSTTYNRSVAHATEENKTGYYKESLGEMNDSSSGKGRGRKGWVIRALLVINDLLPLSLRPVKSKRAHRRRYLGIRHRVFVWRMHWRSHNKNKLKALLKIK